MDTDYQSLAKESRLKVLDLIYKAQTSHIGSNFGVIDMMTVLFSKADPEKDEVILSAGWKAAAWYFFLWKKGIITEEELDSFCQPGSKFIGLVEPMGRWGLKVAGGSMGWGAAMAVGIATAKKVLRQDGRIYVVISDGELQTETMAAVARNAAKRKLENLIFILDNNGFCAMGETKKVLDVDPRHLFYDWGILEIDGHNFTAIEAALESGHLERPTLIIANTIKGKGWKKAEGDNLWHYAQIKEDDYNDALSCLR